MKKFQKLSAVSRQPSAWAGNGRIRILSVLLCSFLAIAFAEAQTTNSSSKMDYSSYSGYIWERNIFNPMRHGPSRMIQQPTTRINRVRPNFSLTGIMSYEHGETPGVYAFFDGTSSDFRKTLQRDGTIGTFKVIAITSDTVTLAQDTNQFVMKVGMAMRQENAGRWILAESSSTFMRGSFSDESGRRRNRNFGNGNNRNFNFSGSPGEMTPPPDSTDTNAMDVVEGDMTNDQGETTTDQTNTQTEATPPQETVTLPAGPASDALMRLMQLRQQEEQSGSGDANQPRN